MQVQINADHNFKDREALVAYFKDVVGQAFIRMNGHINRVEVHLSEENGRKSGGSLKRCVMEVHVKGRQKVAVIHHAEALEQAVGGAADMLTRFIQSALGRLRTPT